MKLEIKYVSTGESYVTGAACINRNILWSELPFCSFDVCVERVDGKSLEQYERELLEKARERITEIYKEIVCSGEPSEASGPLDYLCGKIELSELGKDMLEQIKNNHSNNDLEERIAALEKRLGEQTSSDMLKAIHEVSKKAGQEFLNQAELKKR